MGGRIGRWWLAGPGKWPERVAAVAKTDSKNSLTGGDCGSAGGGRRYELIASREIVTTVPMVWLEENQAIAGGKLKWWRHKSENFKIMENIGNQWVKIKMSGWLRSWHVARSGCLTTHGPVGPTYGYMLYRYGRKVWIETVRTRNGLESRN